MTFNKILRTPKQPPMADKSATPLPGADKGRRDKSQYISNKEKRCGGGDGRAATRAPSPRPHPPLPLLYGLGGPIRPIVGASGERMGNPLWGRGIGGPL